MILTNLLLSASFAAISNFTACVDVPKDGSPQSSADVGRFVCRETSEDIDVGFTSKNGVIVALKHGVVVYYETLGSFFSCQHVELLHSFVGVPKYSRSQVLQIATETVNRLRKDGKPFSLENADINEAGKWHDQVIPFYHITFHSLESKTGSGSIEIDARNGKIVHAALVGSQFWNSVTSGDWVNKCRILDVDTNQTAWQPIWEDLKCPRPSRDRVRYGAGLYSHLCRFLKNPQAVETNVDAVWWEKSCEVPVPGRVNTNIDSVIVFTNASIIRLCEQQLVGFTASDAYFCYGWQVRPRKEEQRFQGRVVYDWKELASKFGNDLSRAFDLPENVVNSYLVNLVSFNPNIGDIGLCRALVEWRKFPPLSARPNGYVGEGVLELCAEFDLSTGEIKLYNVKGPDLMEQVIKSSFGRSK